MKHDPAHAKALTALLKDLKKQYEVEEPLPADSITQLVLGFFQWEATVAKAEAAFEAIMAEVIDLNELRITFPDEIIDIIGEDYPLAESRIGRLRESMNEIFHREHDWKLVSLDAKGKKDQRAYLETLPGIPPYVVAYVMLVAYGGHAMPVDDKLVAKLAKAECCDPDADPADVENFLLRQIKADDALEAHLLFQAWSDSGRAAPSKSAGRKKPTKKKK